MIAENARAAMRLEASLTHDTPPLALLRRQRARLAERVIVMLGVPPTHVAVTADPLRRFGPWPGAVATVTDPDSDIRYRFLARPGEADSAMLLLDECAECTGISVPVAEIESLADLGRYLAAMGRLEPVVSGPGHPVGGPATSPGDTASGGCVDAVAPPVPGEYFGDPGHDTDCAAMTVMPGGWLEA